MRGKTTEEEEEEQEREEEEKGGKKRPKELRVVHEVGPISACLNLMFLCNSSVPD